MTLNSENHQPRNVYIVTQFRRLSEIDTYSGKYYAQFYIESKWNVNKAGAKDTYDPDHDWDPKLYVENSFQDMSEKISYKVMRNETSTTIVEKRYVKGFFLLFFFLLKHFRFYLELFS